MASSTRLLDTGFGVPRLGELTGDRLRDGPELVAVQRELEQLLGTMCADRLTAGETGAGEEDLLVESEARPTDEDQSGDRDGEGLLQTGHDHRADALQ